MKTWSSEHKWEVTIQPPTWWLSVCAASRGPDYKGWCTGQIYDCCLKHPTTGKNLCESLSLVRMSTVQEIQDGQKIISNLSASISRSRTARKNTMIFDIHQLSCSFLVTRKDVFVFFLVSGSETSLLTNFSFKRCIFCFVFCFTWPSPDYWDYFLICLSKYLQKYLACPFSLSDTAVSITWCEGTCAEWTTLWLWHLPPALWLQDQHWSTHMKAL